MVDKDYVTVIAPFFAASKETEKSLHQNFVKWLYSDSTLKKFNDLNLIPKEGLIYTGTRTVDPNTKEIVIIIDKTQKGVSVRQKLDSIERDDHNFVVYIDGDEDIQFDYVFDILEILRSNSDINICLSCRQGKFGLGEVRNNIERFELSLIEQKYGINLPDGQCGCWGLKAPLLNSLSLTAIGFEIELDILISALDAKENPYYIPVKLNKISPTTFNEKEHRAKLNFLIGQLGLNRSLLLGYYENFKKMYQIRLDKKYEQLLNDMAAATFLKFKQVRCKKIELCDRCDLKNK